jgi:hypothetical protein
MPGGRPVKYTKKVVKELLAAFLVYIDEHDIPILAEFAYLNKISRKRLYEFPEFSDAIELCRCKKEANLEKGALTRAIDPGFAKFSLGQLGWRDAYSIEHSVDDPLRAFAEALSKVVSS